MKREIADLVQHARSVYPNTRVTGPVPYDEIALAAQGLSVKIPDDYMSFLLQFGTLSLYGLEVSGLIKGSPTTFGGGNAFAVARRNIEKGQIPDRTLVINYTGYGPVYLLDCSDPAPERAVYGWDFLGVKDPNLDQFETFTDYLADAISTYLADYVSDMKAKGLH